MLGQIHTFMRLTTAHVKTSFVLQLMHMKKLMAVVAILVLALNVAMLLPKRSAKAESNKGSFLKLSKIDLSEVKPGILPGLLKF